MTKKRSKKKQTTKNHNKKTKFSEQTIIKILSIVIILLIIIVGSIIFVKSTIKKEVEKEPSNKIAKKIEDIKVHKKDQFEEYTKDFYKEYEDTTQIIEDKVTKEEEKSVFDNRPKLVIIVDDVTTKHQIYKINDIGYPVTASIMPPTSRHKNSAKIAKNLKFYMIHLPLEASSYSAEEENTLKISDSYEKIEKRVANIRELYPNAIYTNNHTGSKFTSNKEAMDKLFKALKKYDFIFVDSRTTSKSVAQEIALKYDMPYVARNVFLDNEQKYDYIQNQLKKAIKIAKKRDYAIAICHPHSISLKVLKESKDLLKDLNIITLEKLPILLHK